MTDQPTGAVERYTVPADRVALLKATIMPQGSTDNELELFIAVCNRTGLDPFAHQIAATKRGGRLVIQAGIDGLRLIAERTGRYAGQDPVEWCDGEGTWHDVWPYDNETPLAARCRVYKAIPDTHGHGLASFPATVHWREFAKDQAGADGFMWRDMPVHMLGIRAESHALRKAFPVELAGVESEGEPANGSARPLRELDLVTREAYDQLAHDADGWSNFARTLLERDIGKLTSVQQEWLKTWARTHTGPDGHPWPNLHNRREFTPDHASIMDEWIGMAANYAPPCDSDVSPDE